MAFLLSALLITTLVLIATAFFPGSLLFLVLAIPAGIFLRSIRSKKFNRTVLQFLEKQKIKPGEVEGIYVYESIYKKIKFVIVCKDKLVIGSVTSCEEILFKTINQINYSDGIQFGNFDILCLDGSRRRLQIGRGVDPSDLIKVAKQMPLYTWPLIATGGFFSIAAAKAHQTEIQSFAKLMLSKNIEVVKDQKLTQADNRQFGIVLAVCIVYFFLGAAIVIGLQES